MRIYNGFAVAVMPTGHQCKEVLTREAGKPEHLFGLHAKLPANLGHRLSFIQQPLDNRFHRFEQMRAACAVMGDRTVYVLGFIPFVVYDNNRHLAAESGFQGFPSRDCPSMEAVNNREVRPRHYGQCPAIGQDGLCEQLQVVLADLVGVIVIGPQLFPADPLQGGQRRK